MAIFNLKPFLISLLVFLLIAFLAWAYLRYVWFFRDPSRKPEATENAIISPADGKIVYIKKFKGGEVFSSKKGEKVKLEEIAKFDLKGEGWLIGIYMSPLDVHYNYSPIGGKVEKIFHHQAKLNLPMVDLWEYFKLTCLRKAVDLFDKKFHLENERMSFYLKGDDLEVVVVEIADKFVNKIEKFVEEGNEVKAGEKISFIRRGSQVDILIFKRDLEIKVKFGEQVYGGQTVLAFY
jgi:phosphatidylserine decarboxylase